MVNLWCSDTAHGDPAVAEHVDVPLVRHVFDLLWGQASESEHTF
jgi:hypothetical protein